MVEVLPRLISGPRFETYLRASSGAPETAVRLYLWNIQASAALWGPLAILEVVIRNALHDALRSRRRDDWWNDPTVRLMPRERSMIDDAIAGLVRRGIARPSPDQVVAATTFGLWTGLTDGGVPRDPYLSYETALWQPRLAEAFRHAGTVRRKQIHRELDDLRILRNRVAHHEPIYRTDLVRTRDRMVRVAGYVDPDAARLIMALDRSDDLVAQRRELT